VLRRCLDGKAHGVEGYAVACRPIGEEAGFVRRLTIALVAVGLLAGACGDKKDENAGPNPDAAVRLAGPAMGTTVRGNVVTLDVSAVGVHIVKADGDTSGMSAHYHVFIDRTPVAPGSVIPKEPGIIHSATAPIKVTGLKPGTHQIYVVLGDGAHHRLGRSIVHTSVHVKGPSLQVSGPATAKVGEPVAVDVKVEGVELVAANGDTSGRTGHLHVFVDKEPTAAGQAIPKTEGIIHTASAKVDLPAFTTAGEHTVWVVLGDGNHVPFDPPVLDKLTIVVS
jgi:hypothetical protein